MKRLGALTILIPVISGAMGILGSMFAVSGEWMNAKNDIKALQDRVTKVEQIGPELVAQRKLMCAVAIEVVQDKAFVRRVCAEP